MRLPLRAKYDAAQTNDDNRRHWANADGLSAAAANSPNVRRILRNRSRYEVANNSYARGIIDTLANHTIGTGPTLQLLVDPPGTIRRTAKEALTPSAQVEDKFHRWARTINLAAKLRTMRKARATDGEALAILIYNPSLPTEVKLDVRVIEIDQLCAKNATPESMLHDGIDFDSYGNPVRYWIKHDHPGSGTLAGMADPEPIAAANVIHWFRVDRPGQVRGIPEITPALPLFAQLRRFTLATLAAAETAADFAAVLSTEAKAAVDGDDDEVEPFMPIEIEQRAMLTLPRGLKLAQLKAEHPSTTYDMFEKAIIREVGRCLNMPFNIAAGDSSGYNYASGRLDHQVYFTAIDVDQADCELVVLRKILFAWLDEAALIPGMIPDGLPLFIDWQYEWFWPGVAHVDPAKEANAQKTRLESHTTTLASEYAKQGLDWETQLRQRARELELMRELALPIAQSNSQPTDDSDPENDDEEVDEEQLEEAAAA